MDIKKLGRIDSILIELMEHLIDEDLEIAGEARGLINEIAVVKNNVDLANVSQQSELVCNNKLHNWSITIKQPAHIAMELLR